MTCFALRNRSASSGGLGPGCREPPPAGARGSVQRGDARSDSPGPGRVADVVRGVCDPSGCVPGLEKPRASGPPVGRTCCHCHCPCLLKASYNCRRLGCFPHPSDPACVPLKSRSELLHGSARRISDVAFWTFPWPGKHAYRSAASPLCALPFLPGAGGDAGRLSLRFPPALLLRGGF